MDGSLLDQSIDLVQYLLSKDIDLATACSAAEKRFGTPKQVLINLSAPVQVTN